MRTAGLRYIFFICSAVILFLMLYMSRNAGISCDDSLHYEHSLAVYNFFATRGEDRSALETPVTHLKYYGQSYDNVVTIHLFSFKFHSNFIFSFLINPNKKRI